jgi:release factor glutamine methyltransferase
MTVSVALAWALPRVRAVSPRLGAELLLAQVLATSRERVIAHPELALSAEQQAAFEALVARCAAGEPLAYLLGRRAFYGRDFAVDPRVLIPRPETEHLVEAALAWAAGRTGTGRTGTGRMGTGRTGTGRASLRVVDVGTGSGALAVTLALELPGARVLATDRSAAALAVARANAACLGARVSFVAADLLAPLRGPFDLIVANLPYVSRDEQGALTADDDVVKHEPHLALDGGPDGLALVGRLLAEAPARLAPGGALFLEIGAGQAQAAAALARAAFPGAAVAFTRDLAGHERVMGVLP